MASAKNTKKSDVDVKQEDIIIAVLIADSFSTRFAPITVDKPKALLPIVNQPIIDYSLESLLLCGVHKTIVYCVSHADKIRQYLKNSKWMSPVSKMAVEVYSQSSDSCFSLGDALRDIENKALIRTHDFILLSVDVISNVPLLPIFEKHRERKIADKNLLMTHVFRQCFPGHRSRNPEDELVIAINPVSQKILHYQSTSNLKKLGFPLDIFKQHNQIELRYDLVDTHIFICSPLVLTLFTDNFDYQTWGDFVKGILTNADIYDNSIYYHQLEGCYAAQVTNVSMYDAVSKDIIQRWSYPLVPDLKWDVKTPRHTLLRNNVYKQPDVKLAKGSVLEMDTVVGGGTVIGETTHVTRSVIGQNCKIGNNVYLSDAYIWDNVIVKDGCRIDLAIMADDVVLNENVELGRGCILGPGVVIAAGTTIPANTRLMSSPLKDDFSQDEDVVATPISAGSVAYVYQSNREEGSDTESLVDDTWGHEIIEEEEEIEDEEEEEEDDDANSDFGDTDIQDIQDEDVSAFYREVLESMQRGFEEKVKADNLILEINSSKFAYNITMEDVNTLVVKAILSLPEALNPDSITTYKDYLAKLKPILKHFLPVIKNYIKKSASQLECLSFLENYWVDHPKYIESVTYIMKYLYDEEVLAEENLLSWFNQSSNQTVKKHVEAFIRWLEEADEESDEE